MFEEKEVKTVGQHFNMKLFILFLSGIIIGVIFAVPLVERGVFGTDFIVNVIEKKIEHNTETLKEKSTSISGAAVSADAVSLVFSAGEHTLVVADQKAGVSVIMSMVSLSRGGWVAIHEETEEGEMGNILGARRFTEGKHFGSAIDLLRETKGDNTYSVVLHEDDGDAMFDFETEKPARDANGVFVVEKFTALP